MSIQQNTKILASDVTTSLSGKAPTSHASSATTYGMGTGSNYGHVKLSDSTSSTSAASAGIAASPKAVKAAYDKAVEAANSGGSKSVGDLWFGIDPKSKPANVQLYAGQSLNRSSYAAHWAFVNGGNRTVISESEWQAQVTANGFCPYYSSGNGSSTYRMPLLKGIHPRFVEALASAGVYTKAGAPNITGSQVRVVVDAIKDGYSSANGAFSMSNTNATTGTSGGADQIATFDFDASRSSSIYGNSDTVQPPAINMIVGEYVVGTVATIGEANAESLLASVTTLESNVGVLQGGSGFSEAGRAEIVRLGMPNWSAAVSKSVNTDYTAETDGFVFVFVNDNNSSNTGAWSYFKINDVHYKIGHAAGGNNSVGSCCFVPVSKGDRYICYPGRTGHDEDMKFIPCKGVV